MLFSMACECQETVSSRGIPDHMSLTLSGMAAEGPVDHDFEVWGEGQYAVDVVEGERPTARLRLGSEEMELALMPLEDATTLAGGSIETLLLAIELDQPVATHPGAKRTLVRGDFTGARTRAVIAGTLYVDETPDIDVALDLATGATRVEAKGVLRPVDGAPGVERPYTIEGEGISPVDCTYRESADAYGGSLTPPAGQLDVCRALVSEAERMAPSAETPAMPWDPTAPDVYAICGL